MGRNLTAGLLAASLLIPLFLRWIDPPLSSFMVQYFVTHGRFSNQWVPLKEMSPNMPIAVVAAEDQKFPDHWGFDLEAINDAMRENRHRSHPRGASTISQQVAKNLFLWSGRSYIRKGLEAYFTILIEALWPKKRILEVYLNIAEFGPGVYGVASASRIYFHKPPARLMPREAALLAAVLPNPKQFKAAKPSSYIRLRATQIQRQMALLGGRAYLNDL